MTSNVNGKVYKFSNMLYNNNVINDGAHINKNGNKGEQIMAKKITKKERKAMRNAEMEARNNTIRVQNQMSAYEKELEPYWNCIKDWNYFYVDVDLVNKKVSDVKVELLGFPNNLSVRDKEYVLTLASGQPSFYLEPNDILNNAMPIQNKYDDEGNTIFSRFIGFPGDGEKAIYKVKELLEKAADMLHEYYHLNFLLTD